MSIIILALLIWLGMVLYKKNQEKKKKKEEELIICTKCKVRQFPRKYGYHLELFLFRDPYKLPGPYHHICDYCFTEWENTQRKCNWCGKVYLPAQWAEGTRISFMVYCCNSCANNSGTV